jgi:hypothetical protein
MLALSGISWPDILKEGIALREPRKVSLDVVIPGRGGEDRAVLRTRIILLLTRSSGWFLREVPTPCDLSARAEMTRVGGSALIHITG